MTVHAPKIRPHVEALRDAVTELEFFEYGAVPGEKNPRGTSNPGVAPPVYALVQVERVGAAPVAMARHTRRTSWRASLRAVGDTSANNCRIALARLGALENERLTVDGYTSTPLLVESSEDARPDGAGYSALVRFTYSL